MGPHTHSPHTYTHHHPTPPHPTPPHPTPPPAPAPQLDDGSGGGGPADASHWARVAAVLALAPDQVACLAPLRASFAARMHEVMREVRSSRDAPTRVAWGGGKAAQGCGASPGLPAPLPLSLPTPPQHNHNHNHNHNHHYRPPTPSHAPPRLPTTTHPPTHASPEPCSAARSWAA